MQTNPHGTAMPRARRTLSATLTALLVACLLSWAGSSPVSAAAGDGSVSDPHIVYVGRWDTGSGAAAVPAWTGASLQTASPGPR
jgi:hypothetical protein